MNTYDIYKTARNAVWDTIFRYNISELPVPLDDLTHKMGVEIMTKVKADLLIRVFGLQRYADNEGFTASIDNRTVIVYDDTILPPERIRFTIAHELGHIVLGHTEMENPACRNGITVWNQGEQKEPSPYETAANVFASRLLAPACVIHALNIHTADEIAKLCGLSMTAATVRADRMDALYDREEIWLAKYGRSCFGLDWKERRALRQFKEFIKSEMS